MTFEQVVHFLWVHRLEVWWIISLAIGSMVMPVPADGKFYKWFFTFTNSFAANISRAFAAHRDGTNGGTPPKI